MPGAGIRIEAHIDDERALGALREIVSRGLGIEKVMDRIGSYLVTSTVRRFELERAPDGAKWKPSLRAIREKGQTLTDTGRLRASITHRVVGEAVEVGTNVQYAAVHQFGARTAPRMIRPRRKKALFFPGAAHPVRSVRHPGSTIPARPFLGIDADDRRAIRRIVGRFLEAGL